MFPSRFMNGELILPCGVLINTFAQVQEGLLDCMSTKDMPIAPGRLQWSHLVGLTLIDVDGTIDWQDGGDTT